jgi:hypothetical protein
MSKKKQLQHRLENLFNDLQIKEETPIPESSFQYNLPSWNWSSDEEGLYTKVSSQVTDCLGINNENFNGKSIFHYAITPQSGERLRNLFLKGIYPAEIDVYFQTAEGVFVPTRFQILSSPAHNGNKAGFYGFVQVLSENFVEPFITETPSNGNESNFQINDLINQVNQEFKEIGNIDFHHSTVPTTDAGLQAMKKNQLVSQAGSENHPAVIAIPVNMQEDGSGIN